MWAMCAAGWEPRNNRVPSNVTDYFLSHYRCVDPCPSLSSNLLLRSSASMMLYTGNPLAVSCWSDDEFQNQAHDLASVQLASRTAFVIVSLVGVLSFGILCWPWDSPAQFRSRIYLGI